MLSGAVLYLKSGGKVVGALDLRSAVIANGFNLDDGVDEVQVTLGDTTDGTTTNVSARAFVLGEAAGQVMAGAERGGEDPVDAGALFGPVAK